MARPDQTARHISKECLAARNLGPPSRPQRATPWPSYATFVFRLGSGTLLSMWRRYLRITLLFVSAAFAQDRFVAVDADVLRVSRDNTLTRVLQLGPVEFDLRFGSTEPRISPDQHWIAYIKDHNAWLRPTGTGEAIQLTTAGKDSAGRYLPVKVFVVGFTPDSKQLMYSIAPGKDECPDCKRTELLPRKADYGFFLYTLRSRRAWKQPVPESTRVFDIVASDRLFIASVGAYGDVLGLLKLPAHGFDALPPRCASASSCTLAANGSLATCTQIGNDHSQIIECDIRSGTESTVSPEGACITEFQRPSRSPAASHLAYLQIPDRCGSLTRVLWIDQKPRFQCLKADGYGWIDENRLLVQCDQEFVAIDVEGKKLSAIPRKPN